MEEHKKEAAPEVPVQEQQLGVMIYGFINLINKLNSITSINNKS